MKEINEQFDFKNPNLKYDADIALQKERDRLVELRQTLGYFKALIATAKTSIYPETKARLGEYQRLYNITKKEYIQLYNELKKNNQLKEQANDGQKNKDLLANLSDELFHTRGRIDYLRKNYEVNKDEINKLEKYYKIKKQEFDKINDYKEPAFDMNKILPVYTIKDKKGKKIVLRKTDDGTFIDDNGYPYTIEIKNGKSYLVKKPIKKPTTLTKKVEPSTSTQPNVKPKVVDTKKPDNNKQKGKVNNKLDNKSKQNSKPKPKYNYCSTLPFKFGCKNEKIKEVQKCLGLPQRLWTGNFGPYTLKALKNNKYTTNNGITLDIYKTITTACKDSGIHGVKSINTDVDNYPNLPNLGSGLNEKENEKN